MTSHSTLGLLDEATSALDAESEYLVQAWMSKRVIVLFCCSSTLKDTKLLVVWMIAHRYSEKRGHGRRRPSTYLAFLSEFFIL